MSRRLAKPANGVLAFVSNLHRDARTATVQLDLDVAKKNEKARAKAILAKWVETNVLSVEEWPDKRAGRDVQCVVVGEWISGTEIG